MKSRSYVQGNQRKGFRPPRSSSALQGLCDTAIACFRRGDLSKAEGLYRKVLEIDPAYIDGLINLGVVLQGLGRNMEAVTQYEGALRLQPNNADTHLKLGNALALQGRLVEAGLQYERSLILKPDDANSYMNLGNVLQAMSRLNDATICYERALQCDPLLADIYLNYGNLLLLQGSRMKAKAMYERALSVRPDFATAHMNLGRVLEEEERLEEAVASYKQALAIQPQFAATRMNLGNALQAQGKPREAIIEYERALELRPDYLEAHTNLGTALQSIGRLGDAIASHDRALALKPDYALAHVSRAFALLLAGDLSAGWAAHEWRWRVKSFTSPDRNFAQPQWRGEPLHGERILLYGEQGLGDSVQFLRYLPMVQAADGKVILELPLRLQRLAAQLPGVTDFVVFGEPLPAFDWQCPLMSLPLAFDTHLDTIPVQVPYLSIPEEAQQRALAYPWPTDGLCVGLVWAGNPKHKRDRFRSLPFSDLEPVLEVKGINFFSLQMGSGQLTSAHRNIVDLAPYTTDMADTAAQIARLDLVITVDTLVAHLTGALGKPVWVLLSNDADWRWLTVREDSPWYPSARLFRQTELGTWDDVVAQVATSLAKLGGPSQRHSGLL